jgi:hypothetical protein
MGGYYRNEGGESSYQVGRIGVVGAVFWDVRTKSHSRLSFVATAPRPLLLIPLRTTFDHYPTLKWFVVNKKVVGRRWVGMPWRESTINCGLLMR